MIDWGKTSREFGISGLIGYRPKVCVVCDGCGRNGTLTIRSKSKVVDNQISWNCPSCVGKREDVSKKLSKSTSKQWTDEEYKIARISGSKLMWDDPEFRKRHKKGIKSGRPTKRPIVGNTSDALKSKWKDKDYKQKILLSRGSANDKIAKLRDNDQYRMRMAAVRANMPSVSSLQETLYSILDDLGVKYFREYQDKPNDVQCTIGPYNFDCVIPREDKPALLIECQGEYWHNLPKSIAIDKSKSSYINNNFSDQYELKQIWEHEFKCKDRVVETIKYWLGISKIESINFKFSDIVIGGCPSNDYKLLLSKYHYLSNAGRGGLVYGAYLGEELIGVCVFSPPVRQTVAPSLGYDDSEVRELSRLCIHPKYQKYNFASWFVSRCIKQLDQKYKCVISYCDTTFNHNGATYKACNFIEDGIIRPDYWYVDKDGWVMHKKSLYQHACKMGIKEKEYAEKHGYKKIYGQEKLRFVYKRGKDKQRGSI